jgi:hypothetical protein
MRQCTELEKEQQWLEVADYLIVFDQTLCDTPLLAF